MCTLLVGSRVFEDAPLLVAANRDEQLGRPASPPRLFFEGPDPVIAPVDERAGGTWIGVSARGVFAGITNRAGTPPDPERSSRGAIVFEALRAPDAQAGAERVASLPAARFNPFHLFVADRGALHLVWSDGEAMHHAALPSGFHALTERSLGAAQDRRSDRLLSWARAFEGQPRAPHEAALRARLSFHDMTDPFAGTCVHLPPGLPYGTRSSTLLRLGPAPHDLALHHADGPPCRTPHRDCAELVRSALQTQAGTRP